MTVHFFHSYSSLILRNRLFSELVNPLKFDSCVDKLGVTPNKKCRERYISALAPQLIFSEREISRL